MCLSHNCDGWIRSFPEVKRTMKSYVTLTFGKTTKTPVPLVSLRVRMRLFDGLHPSKNWRKISTADWLFYDSISGMEMNAKYPKREPHVTLSVCPVESYWDTKGLLMIRAPLLICRQLVIYFHVLTRNSEN